MNDKLFKGSTAYYINCLIVLLLMFGFRFIPPIGAITEIGMGILGVFLGLVYGWITVGMLWPSLMGLLAFGFTGYSSISDTMIAGFGSNNVLVLIMIFGILGLLESAGLTEYIALKIVDFKVGRGRPWGLIYLLMLAAFVLVAVTCSWASALFVWAIFYKIVENNGIEKGKYTVYVISSIMVATILGGQVFPFSVPVILMTGAFTNTVGVEAAPSFVPYVVWMIVICQLIIVAWLAFGKYILKIPAFEVNTESIEKAKNLNSYQKIVLCFFAGFLFSLILASVLPTAWVFTKTLNGFGVKGLATLVLAVIIMFQFAEGKSFNEYMKRTSWELIIIMAVITVLSNAVSSDTTGIMSTLSKALSPVFVSKGNIVFVILITLIPLVLTNVLNNLVIGFLFVPIAATLCVTLGINPTVIFVMMMLLTSCALATPAGCAPAAMLFGNTEWVTGSQAAKYGVLFAVIAEIITLVIGIPLGSLLF
ncbi:MAG: SLC13 family permease [Dehalobacterium sp.]